MGFLSPFLDDIPADVRFASGDKLHDSDKAVAGDITDNKPGLYPLQALVVPIAARFKFHFDGERPTNRLDKVCIYSM